MSQSLLFGDREEGLCEIPALSTGSFTLFRLTTVHNTVFLPRLSPQSFFKNIFWCGPFLKSLLNLLQYYFCFMFLWNSGHKACGILVPGPWIKPERLCIKRWHLNHWTTRETLALNNFQWKIFPLQSTV